MNWLIAIVKALLLSIWLGGGLFLMIIAAPAAFRTAPSPAAAADMVGAMLGCWHYISILVPLVFLAAGLRHLNSSPFRVVLLSAAIVLGTLQIFADLRVRSIRAHSTAPISDLSPNDPVRRHFGILHGVSALLMLLEILAATGVVASELRNRP